MRGSVRLLALGMALVLAARVCVAQDERRRLVILKIDGLPGGVMERALGEADPAGGRPLLPWIDNVFLKQGAWVRNFYCRGISLSVPSWSMLDSGHRLIIRGNAEHDRYTSRIYDYVNAFPFYRDYARSRKVDMPAVEVLDDAGIPLLLDRFSPMERYQGIQIYQRGVRWKTFEQSLKKRFSTRSPKELFNEWQTGFEMVTAVLEQLERELLAGIANEKILYLDLFNGDFDHIAHLSNNPRDQTRVLQELDGLVGRVWRAIQSSPLAARTVLVLVSDHGLNSVESTYSQGYNLIDVFRSTSGGGHHVMTNRHTMEQYKIKGLNLFVSRVVSPSEESTYLSGRGEEYPTVFLDLDGNERASAHLRNNGLNMLHILLKTLARRDLTPGLGSAAAQAILDIIGARSAAWGVMRSELKTELQALQDEIGREAAWLRGLPKEWTAEDRAAGRDLDARRRAARLESRQKDVAGYGAYEQSLAVLLGLDRARLEKREVRAEAVIPKGIMGDPNSIHDLQNYVVGPSPGGLVLDGAGRLDMEKSFRRVNYFSLLAGLRIRNVVQPQPGVCPVDIIAARVTRDALCAALTAADRPDRDGIWLYADEEHQALILSREGREGNQEIRYLPVARLEQDAGGAVRFDLRDWGNGLPLKLWEDPELRVAGQDRGSWLGSWHTEFEWLNAVHRCVYSNAVIGLTEHFGLAAGGPDSGAFRTNDDRLRRFNLRCRLAVEADLLVLASNHWNFNVRGFNAGGNHGSLLRISTHSTLMFSGAGIQPGVSVEKPYDSLSLVPTLLRLAGKESSQTGHQLPGPVIEEIFPR